MSMRTLPFAAALAAGLIALAAPAMAQEAGDSNGRYVVTQGALDGRPVTVMVDTQQGRTWVLQPDDKTGVAWKRAPVIRFDAPPEGYLARPTTGRSSKSDSSSQ